MQANEDKGYSLIELSMRGAIYFVVLGVTVFRLIESYGINVTCPAEGSCYVTSWT